MDPDDLSLARVRTYRIANVQLPSSNAESRELGWDFNGDDYPENQLGLAYNLLEYVSPAFDVQTHLQPALASALNWTLIIYDDVDDGRIVAAHLVRDGQVDDVPPALLELGELRTTLVGDVAQLPLGAISDSVGGAEPGWIDASALRVGLDAIDDTALQARVGVIVSKRDVDAVVLPNLAAYFTTRLAANDSEFAAMADVNDDGVVSPEELAVTPEVKALLSPDLEGDAFSLGFGVTAVR